MRTLISYEQLEYDVEELREARDKLTEAAQALLGVIDEAGCEPFEKYPGLLEAFDRVQRLL